MLAINGLNVVNSYVGRDFISSVELRDMPLFMRVSVEYVLVFTVCTVVAVLYRFIEERLGLLWRDWQTRQLLDRYLANRTYLRLAAGGEIENPDQRIAEDVRLFATTSLSIFLMSLNAVFTVIAFSGVMWSISPLLFGGAVLYGLLGTLVTICLGRRLVGLNYLQSDREAVFRAELLQVRENAEAMAMLRGEDRVRGRLLQQFGDVVANARQIITVNRNVSFFTAGYNYLVPVIPVFVVAHYFMWGRVGFGVITQSSMAFAQLMGAFSLIVTQFQAMSSYTAVLSRIRGLGDAMAAAPVVPDHALKLVEENGRIACDDVTLKARDGRPLVSNLTFDIGRGGRLLILSDSQRVTRALFRATAGLSCEGEGRITRPDPAHIVFLPERPCLPKDTLRRLMVLSSDVLAVTTAEIEDVLAMVGLSSLPEEFGGLDAEQDWGEALSLEEQSLLAAARALLASPDFVFSDQLGSALDPLKVRGLQEAFSTRGIGHVALVHLPDEGGWYDCVVSIAADGTWK